MFLRSLPKAHVALQIQPGKKPDVFHQLLEALPESDFSNKEKSEFISLLLKREDLGTTAVGDQLALPHAFSSVLTEPCMVLGVSPDGVDFGSLDGDLVYVFLLVLLPDSDEGRSMKREIFQRALAVFSDRFTRQQLRHVQNAKEALAIVRRESEAAVAQKVAL